MYNKKENQLIWENWTGSQFWRREKNAGLNEPEPKPNYRKETQYGLFTYTQNPLTYFGIYGDETNPETWELLNVEVAKNEGKTPLAFNSKDAAYNFIKLNADSIRKIGADLPQNLYTGKI